MLRDELVGACRACEVGRKIQLKIFLLHDLSMKKQYRFGNKHESVPPRIQL
jgi:hypothetical protein